MNSDASIAAGRVIAERYRPILAAALAHHNQEWRSLDLQVALLSGEIASAIDNALKVMKPDTPADVDATEGVKP